MESMTVGQRVPLACKESGKLMARVSATGEWPRTLSLWLWCKACHCEHLMNQQDVEHARAPRVVRNEGQ